MAVPPRSTFLTGRAIPALILLTILGAALRFYRLDGQALWMDEIASLGNADAFGAAGMTGLARADHIAPLHSIILWIAVHFGGRDAIAMRIPSVIAGILTIPAIYWVARRMFGSVQVALIAAGLTAISPYAIWYAQEARMYALLLLCAALFVALSWPVIERRLGIAELMGVTLFSAIGFYAHHYMVLLSFAFGLFLLMRDGPSRILAKLREGRFWAWALTQIVALLLFAYWIMLTADKLHNVAGFSKPALLLWTPYTFFSFVAGASFGPSVHDLRNGLLPALRQDWPLIAIVAISSAILLVRGTIAAFTGRRARGGTWLLLWIVVPIALAILATFVTNVQYNVRYVIVCFPAVLLLLALGIDAIVERWRKTGTLHRPIDVVTVLATVALVGCMLFAVINWYTDDRYAKEDPRALAELLNREHGARLEVADNARIMPILKFYGASIPTTLAIDNIQWGRTPHTIVAALNRNAAQLPPEIWLIQYRSWETDPHALVRSWLDQHARFISEQTWPGVQLRRYSPTSSKNAKPVGASSTRLPSSQAKPFL